MTASFEQQLPASLMGCQELLLDMYEALIFDTVLHAVICATAAIRGVTYMCIMIFLSSRGVTSISIYVDRYSASAL